MALFIHHQDLRREKDSYNNQDSSFGYIYETSPLHKRTKKFNVIPTDQEKGCVVLDHSILSSFHTNIYQNNSVQEITKYMHISHEQ